jgi:anti-sigma B factor antagonist
VAQPDSRQEPAVVVFPLEVDVSNSEAFGAALLAALRSDVSVVIADLSGTQFCDSSAIRHLITAHNQAACTSAELRVVISSPVVRRALHVLEADQLLRLHPDMESALTGALRSADG